MKAAMKENTDRRGRTRRAATAISLLALLLGAMAPVAASTPVAEVAPGEGVVRVGVRYVDADGRVQRLAGAEVFLLEVPPGAPVPEHMGPGSHPAGNERFECTDATGVAVFLHVPADTDLWVSTGVGRPDRCSNSEYLNPSTGHKMLSVDWQGNFSGGLYVPFSITDGERLPIVMRTRTPLSQQTVCGGFFTTWVGTVGDDVFMGTPERDVVFARAGNDVIRGLGGDDVICAGPGNDQISGTDGRDIIFGERGKDRIAGGPNDDWVFGGPDSDTCVGAEYAIDCETLP